jgi:hypothetical protein
MNAAGQVLFEYVLIMLVFLLLVAKLANYIPTTFGKASPYLGAKIEQRLEAGNGFATLKPGFYLPPAAPKGGVKD